MKGEGIRIRYHLGLLSFKRDGEEVWQEMSVWRRRAFIAAAAAIAMFFIGIVMAFIVAIILAFIAAFNLVASVFGLLLAADPMNVLIGAAAAVCLVAVSHVILRATGRQGFVRRVLRDGEFELRFGIGRDSFKKLD